MLATIFVHCRLAERAFVPYVIASQTIPIVALAPLIVVGLGRGITSVVFIAVYLTFFPVTIAEMRGLRSPGPARAGADALLRRVALVDLLEGAPAGVGAVPVHGAQDRRHGERRGHHHRRGSGRASGEGLGRAIVNFNQQYITGPEKLWATILVASLVGMAFYLVVRVAEVIALRGRRVAEA